jgi:twitching motility protein PilT
MTIHDLLQKTISAKASDLHLTVGSPPVLRIAGKLSPISETKPLDAKQSEELIFALLNEEQTGRLQNEREIDLSLSFGDVARFRINAFYQKGYLTAALRLIPFEIPTIEELNLPKILYDFCKLPQGFVLITGPAGQGKSTTLAAMINEINETREVHVITIEDPIEYVFESKRALIVQREMYLDTLSWQTALRSALREDPDVVLVGEMRDFETMAAAMTIAETGHLVFATLHTNSAAQTVNRIIDVFPENQQQQVRTQLAAGLEGIVSQRLLPAIGGGRLPACEVLLATPAVRAVIREGKTHQIDNTIATSYEVGMVSLNRALAELVKNGKVSLDVAKMRTLNPEELIRMVR